MYYSRSTQNTALKDTEYLQNEKSFKSGKIGHFAKATAFAKLSGQFGVKIKNAKNMPKSTLEINYSSFIREKIKKKQYLKNDQF